MEDTTCPRPMHKREHDIKMDLKETQCELDLSCSGQSCSMRLQTWH